MTGRRPWSPVTVTDPDGRTWVIRRRWRPRATRHLVPRSGRRIAGTTFDTVAGLGDLADLPIVGVVFLVPLVLALLVALLIGLPILLLIIVAMAVTAVATVLAVIARVVLRRPWTVDAASDAELREWAVVGGRLAAAWRDELGERFAAGDDPRPESTRPTAA